MCTLYISIPLQLHFISIISVQLHFITGLEIHSPGRAAGKSLVSLRRGGRATPSFPSPLLLFQPAPSSRAGPHRRQRATTARAPTSRPPARSTATRVPALRPRPRGLTRSGATAPVGCRSSASSLSALLFCKTKKKRKRKRGRVSRSSRLHAIVLLSGYFFSIPRCPVIFNGTNSRDCFPFGGSHGCSTALGVSHG
jgi:hypothetical protein